MNVFRTIVAAIILILALSVERYVWSTQDDVARTVYRALDNLSFQRPGFTEDNVFAKVKFGIEQQRLNPNYVDTGTGLSLLMYAARTGSLKIVKYLVEHGADVHYQSPLYETALMYAALAGDLPLVKYLVEEKKADINSVSYGWDVLKWGKDFDQSKEVADYLRSKGAKPSQYEWGQKQRQPTHFHS